jgi:F0F1-type ATP synthase membrane subunit b/b'
MDAATKEAQGIIEEARATLAKETEKARTALSSDAQKYASEIAGKLLKV